MHQPIDGKPFERQQRQNRWRLSGTLAGAIHAELERNGHKRMTKGEIAEIINRSLRSVLEFLILKPKPEEPTDDQ